MVEPSLMPDVINYIYSFTLFPKDVLEVSSYGIDNQLPRTIEIAKK
ncbi:hypothetical protein [Nostoc sp. 106C]|nr:hypothetical protein [Nostoc sp. 106C]